MNHVAEGYDQARQEITDAISQFNGGGMPHTSTFRMALDGGTDAGQVHLKRGDNLFIVEDDNFVDHKYVIEDDGVIEVVSPQMQPGENSDDFTARRRQIEASKTNETYLGIGEDVVGFLKLAAKRIRDSRATTVDETLEHLARRTEYDKKRGMKPQMRE